MRTAEGATATVNGNGHAADDGGNGFVRKPVTPEVLRAAMGEENFALTDLGLANRTLIMHGDKIRHCPRFKKFLVWTGQRNELDERGMVDQLIVETIQALKLEAAALKDPTAARALFNFALKSESNSKINAAAERLSKLPGVYVSPDELDRDVWLFNVQNGTLDLRTRELRPHRQADLITRIAPVSFDPEARCPLYLATLRRIFNDNENLIGFWRRLSGYTLTGLTTERMMAILYGTGCNGKSTLLAVIRHIMGDYAAQMPSGMLLAKRNDGGIPNDLARLKGIRFASASETDEGRRLAEAAVKQMTGGADAITARFLFGEFFDFQPEFKLYVATNHKPEIRGTDPAIWDRLKLIPFDVRIPDDQRDPDLIEKLKAEADGIFRWMVAGCQEWRQFGLQAPHEVAAATESYRTEMDRLGEFIAERCEVGPHLEAGATPLYETYKGWCVTRSEEPLTQTRFGRQLEERGYRSQRCKTTGRTVRTGIGIRVFD